MDQKTIAAILGTTQQNVAYHLNKKFESGELSKEKNEVNPQNTKEFCKLKINIRTANQPKIYNLDAIISVAYSVNSIQAAKVRKWSNGIKIWGDAYCTSLTNFLANNVNKRFARFPHHLSINPSKKRISQSFTIFLI